MDFHIPLWAYGMFTSSIGFIVALVILFLVSRFTRTVSVGADRQSVLESFIAALNTINTPWVAITVILLGMVFDVVSHVYGLNSDTANQVIGAGIGLLTGQALNKAQQPGQHVQIDTNPPLAPGQVPVNQPQQPTK